MYDYIKGTMIRIDANVAVLECAGIGYRINCTLTDIGFLSQKIGSEVLLYIYLNI